MMTDANLIPLNSEVWALGEVIDFLSHEGGFGPVFAVGETLKSIISESEPAGTLQLLADGRYFTVDCPASLALQKEYGAVEFTPHKATFRVTKTRYDGSMPVPRTDTKVELYLIDRRAVSFLQHPEVRQTGVPALEVFVNLPNPVNAWQQIEGVLLADINTQATPADEAVEAPKTAENDMGGVDTPLKKRRKRG